MTPSPRSFLIWGGGGHGKVVADLVRACGHRVAGFIDADAKKVRQCVGSGEARVEYTEEVFLGLVRGRRGCPAGIAGVALGIGHNASREAALRCLDGCRAPVLVHPSASVSPTAKIGRGTVVLSLAVINAEARIGAGAIVNSGAIVEHDCEIEDGVHVSPGAVIAGGARIGRRSWVGAGATVIEGIVIGADVIVGAGAVVIRDVPDGVTVGGVPAKLLRAKVVTGT